METITRDMIINDVIKRFPKTIKVFNDYKVDSCCGGGAPIETTAKRDGVDIDGLLKALNEALGKEGSSMR
jgi:regulator of cell morphogenesis and NO signaling